MRSRASSLAVFRNVSFVFLSSVMRLHYAGLVLTTLIRIKKNLLNAKFVALHGDRPVVWTQASKVMHKGGDDKMQRNRGGIRVEH